MWKQRASPYIFLEYITHKYKDDDKKRLDIIYGDEDKEPLVYPFFEWIIRRKFLQLISDYLKNKNNDVLIELKKMTDFFEKMATSNDFEVLNLLGVGILEGITIDKDEFELIRGLLGEQSNKILDSTSEY